MKRKIRYSVGLHSFTVKESAIDVKYFRRRV
jgi:hypothetical protein